MESSRLFGENPGLVIINPARSIRPWFCVPEGSYALVQSFGQYQKYNKSGSYVWPAGFHWATYWHFTRVATLVTKQSIVLDMPVKGCKTQDNVTVQINLAVVFRIMGDTK